VRQRQEPDVGCRRGSLRASGNPTRSRTAHRTCAAAAGLAVTVALVGCSTAASSRADVAAAVEADLTAFLEQADPYDKTRAVLVYHAGEPVLERYTGATEEDYWDLQSVTKSVIGTLIGIAIEQGHLDGVDQTLGELLPDHVDVMTPEVAAITLHEVLTHTAGMSPSPSPEAGVRYWESPDWVRTILADRAETTATTDGSFAYSNAGSHLLAAILVEATGRSVLDYARAALFGPLGIPSTPAFEPSVGDYDADPDGTLREYYESDFAWPVDPQGVHEGAALLRLRPVDLAAIGLLHLQNGQWDGEQVVPADWVAASTTRQADVATSAEDYGYQWWVTDVDDDAAYLARGYGGQLIAVVPERDLVVVVAAEFDLRDPLRNSTMLGDAAAAEAFRTWIAPHFAN
jgi:CubicO group peptidase (beta-lactamase class C family)